VVAWLARKVRQVWLDGWAGTLGSNHDQVPAPVAAESVGHKPNEFVARAEPRSLPGRPGQYRELMTEQEILDHERLTVAHRRTEKAEQEK
jgi:hypothetical protein